MKRILIILIGAALLAAPAAATTAGSVRSGNGWYKKGRYDRALDKYRDAQISSPDNPVVQFNTGDALYKQESYDESTAAFNRALASKDRLVRSKAYYNLGNAAFRQQKTDEALAYYKKALGLNPADRDAKYNIEYLLLQKKNPKQDTKDQKDRNKGSKDKQQQGAQGKDGQKNGEQQKQDQGQSKSGMSREDAQRILQYYNESDKDTAKKRRMALPPLPKVEEDW